jgi:CheY-like chemotaxis protein
MVVVASVRAPTQALHASPLHCGTVDKQKTKILVVDDSEAVRSFVTGSLQHLGCEVITAGDGEEGVRVALASRPRIILMDLYMPRMDGWQACQAIRAAEEANGWPRIIILAMSSAADKEACEAAGMDDLIQKPASLELLSQILSRYCDESPNDVELARGKEETPT